MSLNVQARNLYLFQDQLAEKVGSQNLSVPQVKELFRVVSEKIDINSPRLITNPFEHAVYNRVYGIFCGLDAVYSHLLKTIWVKTKEYREDVILHELAHAYFFQKGQPYESHGPRYVGLLLHLLAWYYDLDEASLVNQALDHNIKVEAFDF